jgi:hypothetical protein
MAENSCKDRINDFALHQGKAVFVTGTLDNAVVEEPLITQEAIAAVADWIMTHEKILIMRN